jgi:hypothetical protein
VVTKSLMDAGFHFGSQVTFQSYWAIMSSNPTTFRLTTSRCCWLCCSLRGVS